MNAKHNTPLRAFSRAFLQPNVLLIVYIWIAYFSALRASCADDNSVPFGYGLYFSCADVWSDVSIPAFQTGSVLAGGLFFYLLGEAKLTTRVSFELKYSHGFLALFVLSVVFYFVLNVAINYTDNDRVNSSKFSQILVIVSSFFASVLISNNNYRYFMLVSLTIIVLLFATVDFSRTSIIPVVVGFVFLILNGRIFTALLLIPVLIFLNIFVLVGRDSFDVYTALVTMSEHNLSDFNISYLTSFSYLHFLYARDFSDIFTFQDLLYSITPLPSALLTSGTSPVYWRVDIYRPLGAMAELYSLGFAYFLLFHITIGFVGKSLHKNSKFYFDMNNSRILGIIFITICFAAAYQYHLRSVQWLFYTSFLCSLYSNSQRHRAQNYANGAIG